MRSRCRLPVALVLAVTALSPGCGITRTEQFDIVMRSIDVSSRSGSLNAMRQLYLLTEVARLKHHTDVELRFVAIPDGWRPPKAGTFVKETMESLADLGEKMGADPKSWLTRPPVQ